MSGSEAPPAGTDDARRMQVRDRYARAATSGGCCGSSGENASSCCGGSGSDSGGCGTTDTLIQLGYTAEEIAGIPPEANLGLGCGNPTALGSLRPGEVVLDLGSGAGIDCFLAAKKVGGIGRVIGVDMTPEMVAKARANGRASGLANVEFRLGEIEHLPVADRSVDVVISNCVINLVPDKYSVYREAFRVLRPGGRFAVSDVVATRPITADERADPSLWSSCSSGALEVPEIRERLASAGFDRIDIALKVSAGEAESLDGQRSLGVVPADIRAYRPAEGPG